MPENETELLQTFRRLIEKLTLERWREFARWCVGQRYMSWAPPRPGTLLQEENMTWIRMRFLNPEIPIAGIRMVLFLNVLAEDYSPLRDSAQELEVHQDVVGEALAALVRALQAEGKLDLQS